MVSSDQVNLIILDEIKYKSEKTSRGKRKMADKEETKIDIGLFTLLREHGFDISDDNAAQGFCSFLKTLPEKTDTLVRFFDRGVSLCCKKCLGT